MGTFWWPEPYPIVCGWCCLLSARAINIYVFRGPFCLCHGVRFVCDTTEIERGTFAVLVAKKRYTKANWGPSFRNMALVWLTHDDSEKIPYHMPDYSDGPDTALNAAIKSAGKWRPPNGLHPRKWAKTSSWIWLMLGSVLLFLGRFLTRKVYYAANARLAYHTQ